MQRRMHLSCAVLAEAAGRISGVIKVFGNSTHVHCIMRREAFGTGSRGGARTAVKRGRDKLGSPRPLPGGLAPGGFGRTSRSLKLQVSGTIEGVGITSDGDGAGWFVGRGGLEIARGMHA